MISEGGLKTILHHSLIIALVAIGFPVWSLALALLLTAETAGGRLTALLFVFGVIGAIHLLWRGRARWGVSAGLLGAAFGCWLGAYLLAPSADAVRSTGISVYLGDSDHARGALANLVPEIDQFTLGSHLVPAVDPFIDAAQAARIRHLFQRVYAELRADPVFARAGSTMNAAYAELFGGEWRTDHLYRYPPAGPGPARPVLLFLHGSAGNFLGYLWVLKRFADAHGWAVVAPDHGFGNWNRGDPDAVFAKTLKYIDARPDLDGSRIVLAGLSNGGLGVARALKHAPERYRAVVLFSAITTLLDDGVPTKVPFFLLHGDQDRRIPVDAVRYTTARLRADGVPVELVTRPSDHFLFFEDFAAIDAILQRAFAAQ